MIKFYPDTHRYESIDLFEPIEWVSASKIAGMFKQPFDGPATAAKCSEKVKSKWFGIPPDEILQIWKKENLRSTTLGTWYHEKEESKLIGLETTTEYGYELPIFRPIWEDGVKIAGEQKLVDGVYPEHLAYSKIAGACGQFDKIIVAGGYVHNHDHKSNKDLKKPAFVNYRGQTQRMLPPLAHLDDCKLVEYAIQLSIGLYIILRHNPHLKPGECILNHCTFEIEGEDKYGYPIMKLDENNEPILKGVEPIVVPYMKREVEIIFDHLKKKANVVR
jgi:hypothetical protein